jgi:hypothetical protein
MKCDLGPFFLGALLTVHLPMILVAFGGLSFGRFWGEFLHHPSIMSLLFFPRPLDEIAFGPVWSLVRVPPITNLLPEEMLVYKQLKIGFTIYVHLKVPHDTPPLRSFDLLVSRVLELPSSSPWKPLFNIPGFCPLLTTFHHILHAASRYIQVLIFAHGTSNGRLGVPTVGMSSVVVDSVRA